MALGKPRPPKIVNQVRLIPALLLAALFALAAPAIAELSSPFFAEEALQRGLDFQYRNGMSGKYRDPEIFGSGVALFDYDGDGDLDVFLAQGGDLENSLSPDTPEIRRSELSGRLFRNDLGANGGLQFVDVTATSGIRAFGYGMGLATGDIDNDGDMDLYLTNYGPNQLWRNRGDGSFEEITAGAGVDDPRWSVPATFFDFDSDGLLDLYVGNYLDYRVSDHKKCFSEIGTFDYCHPQAHLAVGDRLFRNLGKGRFEDVTSRAGLDRIRGKALGSIAADFDRDGYLDLYVGNDLLENHLWQGQADGTFVEDALFAGCALNSEGQPEGSMGIDARDFDHDGDEDLFMTHAASQTNTLFENDGAGVFRDRTLDLGLSSASFQTTAFGTAFFDLDQDGVLEILAVNGAVRALDSLVRERDAFPYHQRNHLFRRQGDASYREIGAAAGPALALSEVSRSAAFGDLDRDGDTDVVIGNIEAPVRLLMNLVGQDNSWIGVRGIELGRDGFGAWVGAMSSRGEQWQRLRTDGSYGAANDPHLNYGLGSEASKINAEVHWLLGGQSRWVGIPANRYYLMSSPARP